MTAILARAGKTVIEFGGIMPNPTYAKVQEGAKLARENHVDLILAVGGGSVIDCYYFGKPHDHKNLSDDISEAVMRGVIANMRLLLTDHESYEARSELMWASAMAENGILKIGKVTDFQCHQMEHQLGAYTDCNHGLGLAVLHPVLYRHIYKEGIPKFKNFAVRVWGIDPSGKTDEEVARLGVEALADFIKEMGLPASFAEMGIAPDTDYKAIADSCNLTAGCCRKLSREELLEIFLECR